jgi:hypothetical protein
MMPQRIEFAPLPATDERQYVYTLVKLLAHVNRTKGLTFKDFREWLKLNNLWSKAETPVFLDFLGLRQDAAGKVASGPFLARFLAEDDEEPQRRVVIQQLIDSNPLLAKYVLDALNPEVDGGRLNSTHELHRMLSSFVYPGAKLTLPSFKAWVSWAVGAGLIKLVGIRWGLADLGREYAAKVKHFDVEEFLEDESGGAADQEDDEEQDGAGATEQAATAEPGEATEEEAGAEEAGEATPEPEASVEPAPRPASSARPKPASAPAARPAVVQGAPQAPPVVTWLAPSVPVVPLWGPGNAEVEANRGLLANLWEKTAPQAPVLTLEALGMSAEDFQEQPERFLFQVAFASLLADLPGLRANLPAHVALFRQLADQGFFESYVDLDLPLEEALTDPAWVLDVPEPNLRDRWIYLVPLKRNLRRDPDWFSHVQGLTDPLELVTALRNGPLAGVPAVMAPFWLVREMHRAELLTHPAHAQLAVVPGIRGREAAVRLGFLDRAYANGDADLTRAGVHLSAWFDRDTGYAEPLEQLTALAGCHAACGHALHCPFQCAEKLPWNKA